MLKRTFLLICTLLFALCVSGCGIDSDEDLFSAVLDECGWPEDLRGEVLVRWEDKDYEYDIYKEYLILFHGESYLDDRACIASVTDGILSKVTGPRLSSVFSREYLKDGFAEINTGSYLIVTNPDAAYVTMTDSNNDGYYEEITSLPFLFKTNRVYVCRVLDSDGNVLYER